MHYFGGAAALLFIVAIAATFELTTPYTCDSTTNCNNKFIANQSTLTCNSQCNKQVKFACADNVDCVVTIKPKSGFKNSKIYAETANSLTVNCSGATSCNNLKILCPTKSKSVCKAMGNVPSTLTLYCPLGNDKSCDASGGSIQYMERNGMAASWAKDTVKSVGRQPSNYSCTKNSVEWSTAYECRRKCFDTMTCNLVVRYGCMATSNFIRKEDKDAYHCILYTCQNISKITWVPNVEKPPTFSSAINTEKRNQACSYLLELKALTSETQNILDRVNSLDLEKDNNNSMNHNESILLRDNLLEDLRGAIRTNDENSESIVEAIDTITNDQHLVSKKAANLSIMLMTQILQHSDSSNYSNATLTKCVDIVSNVLGALSILDSGNGINAGAGDFNNSIDISKKIEEKVTLVNGLTNVIHKLSLVQAKTLTIGETAKIEGEKILIVTKKEKPSELATQDFDIGSSGLKFPMAIGSHLSPNNHTSINVAMVEWKTNPYQILSTSRIVSNVLSVSLMSSLGTTLKIDNLETPIIFTLESSYERKDKDRGRRLLFKSSSLDDRLGSAIEKNQNDNTIYINCTYLMLLNYSSTGAENRGTVTDGAKKAYLFDNDNRFISEADVLHCHWSSTIFYCVILMVGTVLLCTLVYQLKTNKERRRQFAISQAILLIVFVVVYVIVILLTCSNAELLPRFLHGFSALIFGMCVSGAVVGLATMILLVLFFCTTKNRQSDTWQYIDWPLYVTYSSVLPILIFSIILWSKSVALSDMVRGESDAMNYYAPTDSFAASCKSTNANITYGTMVIEEQRCKYWDLSNRAWSSAGCTIEENMCKCNHLTDFAKTLEKSGNRLTTMFDSPLDALRAHWGVPLTLSAMFSLYFVCLLSTAMVDTYAGRRFKMEGALFVALLAISRMRRRARKKKNRMLNSKRLAYTRWRGAVELQKLRKQLDQSITFQKYAHGVESTRYIDMYVDTLKKRHDVLAIFYNPHLYFGRKELLSILFIRALLKVVVISLLFEFKIAYTTTKVVQGSPDLLLFKILTILFSFVTNKIVGTIIKEFFVKYVNAKRNYHLGYYKLKMKKQASASENYPKNGRASMLPQIKKNRASLLVKRKNLKRDSRYVITMRLVVWTTSILIILGALLFMWVFAFTIQSEFLLDTWLESCGISLCCWLLLIRPLQLAFEAKGKWKKKKKRYETHMQLIENKMMSNIISNFQSSDGRNIEKNNCVEIEMPAIAVAIIDDNSVHDEDNQKKSNREITTKDLEMIS